MRGCAMEDGFGETVLAAEVIVQQGAVDARFFRNLLHTGAGGPCPEEHGVRGIENPLLGVAVAPFTVLFNHSVKQRYVQPPSPVNESRSVEADVSTSAKATVDPP